MKCSTIPNQQGKNGIHGLVGILPEKGEPRHAELNAGFEIAHIPMGAMPNK